MGSFLQFARLKADFLFTNEKMPWMLTGAVSLETVLLGTQDKCLKWMDLGVSPTLHTLFDQCDI